MQNFYQLLSVEPTATSDEIKRAFRNEIARYHPDKVQHLGKEFQDIAASRAAALTEAYRTLMNAELRAEYDRVHLTSVAAAPASTVAPHQPGPPASARPDAPEIQIPTQHGHRDFTPPPRFASERRDRDDLVRKATMGRFRAALSAEVGGLEELAARGFDLDFEVKSSKKLFSRTEGQRYAVKIVPTVDKIAVQEAWSAAQKASLPICVFLMGSRVAPAKELAEVIGDLRRRTRTATTISISPVDGRDWTAHMPSDAPSSCRNVLKRLRAASTV